MSKKDSINKQLTLSEKTGLRNAIRNTRDMALRYPRGADGLTEKQRIFVEIYTANEGRLTPTECARQSGYKESVRLPPPLNYKTLINIPRLFQLS